VELLNVTHSVFAIKSVNEVELPQVLCIVLAIVGVDIDMANSITPTWTTIV